MKTFLFRVSVIFFTKVERAGKDLTTVIVGASVLIPHKASAIWLDLLFAPSVTLPYSKKWWGEQRVNQHSIDKHFPTNHMEVLLTTLTLKDPQVTEHNIQNWTTAGVEGDHGMCGMCENEMHAKKEGGGQLFFSPCSKRVNHSNGFNWN